MIDPKRISTPLTTAAAPLMAEKTMTSKAGTPRRNVADGEDRADDQADDDPEDAASMPSQSMRPTPSM